MNQFSREDDNVPDAIPQQSRSLGVRTEQTEVNLAGPIEFAPGANVGRFYANHASSNITLFEVRLLLNFITGNNPEGKLMVQESLWVSMSPELAYAVHSLLTQALESYRQNYGELRLPKQVRSEEPAAKE